eukprot:tig00020553_g10514.t1
MFSAVTDAFERAEFQGPYGWTSLVVLRTDAGPCVCVPELRRLVAFTGSDAHLGETFGVPTRPLRDENSILLLETLGALPRRHYDAQERPPHVLPLRYLETVVGNSWERSQDARMHRAAAELYAALEKRTQGTLQRLEMQVIRAAGDRFLAVRARRIETPELQWWIPLASLAQAAYGDSRSTNCVRQEIVRKHPDLAVGGPHRFEANTRSVGRERLALLTRTLVHFGGLGADVATYGSARRWAFISTLGCEKVLAALPDRAPGLVAEFKRARLVLEGADPATLDAAPSLPLTPARRVSIFGRRTWLKDAEIANVLTLLLLRAHAGDRVKALYPMHVEILASLLRRHARSDEARRGRRVLGAAERGACVLCPVSVGNLRRGAERTRGWATGGHWTLLAVDGSARRVQYWDSLGEVPAPHLQHAAMAAFPRYPFVVETAGRLQGDGYQCGAWTLWFAEAKTHEVITGFPWSDEIDSGSLSYVYPGEPISSAIAAENGRFIAEKREAYRTMLESGVVDQAVTLFDEDELPDAERVVLPPIPQRPAASRAGSKPTASAHAAPSPSPTVVSSSSSRSSEEAEGVGAGGDDGEGAELKLEEDAGEGDDGPEPEPERLAPYALRESDMSRDLRNQLAAFQTWRTSALNPDRQGGAAERSTVLVNDVGTICRLLGYVRERERIGPLTMDLFARADFVEIYLRFLDYLRTERRLAAGTLAGYTQSVMQAYAFVRSRTAGAEAGAEGPHTRPLRNLKTQLEKEKKQQRGWRKRGPNWVSLEAVLSARRDALGAYEAAALERDKALALREAVLIGFLSITPARVGVVRRLQIGQTLRRDGGAWAISLTEMRHGETGELVSKTAKSHGAIVVPIAAPLQGPLDAYVERYRGLLLPAGRADEGWLFASSNGTCLSESGWAVFVRRVMVKYVGVPITAKTMRAIITTHVREQAAANLIEGDTAAAVVEGVARLLAHTPQTATLHYDYGARQRSAASAVAYLERLALQHEARAAAPPPEGPAELPAPPSPEPAPPSAPAAAASAAASASASSSSSSRAPAEGPASSPPAAGRPAARAGGSGTSSGTSRGTSTASGTGSARTSAASDEERGASESSAERPRKPKRYPWQRRRLDPGDQMELDLARGEGRYCEACERIFQTIGGARQHARGCSGRGGRTRARRGGGGGRGGRKGHGEASASAPALPLPAVPVAQPAGPPPPLHHLVWVSASPFPPGTAAAAIATHSADPLPRTVFCRLVGNVRLPSGEFESRWVVLKRYGSFWTPSQEGSARDWRGVRALTPVDYDARNGSVDIKTPAARISDLLGLGGGASAPSPPAPRSGAGVRGEGSAFRPRGRPRKRPDT